MAAMAPASTDDALEPPSARYEHIHGKLLPFQRTGVEWAISRGSRVLIADEMGLGKTVQAIALLARYESEWPALVVCPASMRGAWADELERWLPTLPANRIRLVRGRADVEAVSDPSAAIVVCTYGLLTKDAPAAAALGGRGFGVVVVDESHALKTRGSQRGLALAPVLAAAARLVLLSGTPALNRPAELYPQLAPLAPQLVGGWSAFAARYCGARRGRFGWEANGATHLDELRERLLAPLMIRRKKADVLTELPRKRRQRVGLESETRSPASVELAALSAERRATGLDARLLSGREGWEANAAHRILMGRCWQATGLAKLELACAYVLECLHGSDETEKVLLFAHHKAVLDGLEAALVRAKVQLIRIDGATPAAERTRLVAAFQQSPGVRVALLSVTAAGQGLTLTAASTVIFAELHWVPGVLLQAEDRAHRIGQRSAVQVKYLFLNGADSFDEALWAAIARKTDVCARALDGADAGAGLGAEDVAVRAQPAGAETAADDDDAAAAAAAADDDDGIREFFADAAPQGSAGRTAADGGGRGRGNKAKAAAGASSSAAVVVGDIRTFFRKAPTGAVSRTPVARSRPPTPASAASIRAAGGASLGAAHGSAARPFDLTEATPCGQAVAATAEAAEAAEAEAAEVATAIAAVAAAEAAEAAAERARRRRSASPRCTQSGAQSGAAPSGSQSGAVSSQSGAAGAGADADAEALALVAAIGFAVSANSRRIALVPLSATPLADTAAVADLPSAEPAAAAAAAAASVPPLASIAPALLRTAAGTGEDHADAHARADARAALDAQLGAALGCGARAAAAVRNALCEFSGQWERLPAASRAALCGQPLQTASLGHAAAAALAAGGGGGALGGCFARYAPAAAAAAAGAAGGERNGGARGGGCGWCGAAVAAAEGGASGGAWAWCGWDCRQQLLLRSSGAIRRQLFALEAGKCASCGRDAHGLFLKLRRLQPPERLQLLLAHDWPWTQRMLQAPAEGDFWQADHTLPVSEGGGCCGIANFRTLCSPCHRAETAQLRLRLDARKRKASAAGTADVRSCFARQASSAAASHL